MRIRRIHDKAGSLARLELTFLEPELESIRELPIRLRHILERPQEHAAYLDRLFPPASHHDERIAGEYRRIIGNSLFDERRESLAAFERTLAGPHVHLGAVELDLWLHVINDMRLILGIRLDVNDNDYWDRGPADPADRDLFRFASWLGAIQSRLIDAWTADDD